MPHERPIADSGRKSEYEAAKADLAAKGQRSSQERRIPSNRKDCEPRARPRERERLYASGRSSPDHSPVGDQRKSRADSCERDRVEAE